MAVCNGLILRSRGPSRAARIKATKSRNTSRISPVSPRAINATSTLIINIVTKSATTVANKTV